MREELLKVDKVSPRGAVVRDRTAGPPLPLEILAQHSPANQGGGT